MNYRTEWMTSEGVEVILKCEVEEKFSGAEGGGHLILRTGKVEIGNSG
jgi:hypothetical protein